MLSIRKTSNENIPPLSDQYSLEPIKSLFQSAKFGEEFHLFYELDMRASSERTTFGEYRNPEGIENATPEKLFILLYKLNTAILEFIDHPLFNQKGKMGIMLEIKLINTRTNEGVFYRFTELKAWDDFALFLAQQVENLLKLDSTKQKQLEVNHDLKDSQVNTRSNKCFPFWSGKSKTVDEKPEEKEDLNEKGKVVSNYLLRSKGNL